MMPKKTTKGKSQCDLCCEPIVDEKEDALQCEGSCQLWMHRYCAGVTQSHFKVLASGSNPFVCLHCLQETHLAAVVQLQDEIAVLKAEVTELRANSIENCAASSNDPASSNDHDHGQELREIRENVKVLAERVATLQRISEESDGVAVTMKPKSFAEAVGGGDKGGHEVKGGAGSSRSQWNITERSGDRGGHGGGHGGGRGGGGGGGCGSGGGGRGGGRGGGGGGGGGGGHGGGWGGSGGAYGDARSKHSDGSHRMDPNSRNESGMGRRKSALSTLKGARKVWGTLRSTSSVAV